MIDVRVVGADDWHVRARAFGVFLRIDPYGLTLHRTQAWLAAQFAENAPDSDRDEEHCCGCEHPDRACEHDVEFGFSEDDLMGLLVRARNGDHPVELFAEFVAGVRGEPDDDTADDA